MVDLIGDCFLSRTENYEISVRNWRGEIDSFRVYCIKKLFPGKTVVSLRQQITLVVVVTRIDPTDLLKDVEDVTVNDEMKHEETISLSK